MARQDMGPCLKCKKPTSHWTQKCNECRKRKCTKCGRIQAFYKHQDICDSCRSRRERTVDRNDLKMGA